MRPLTWLALVALGTGAACGDSNNLPAPSRANVIQHVTLFSLRGTPIHQPSGYSITGRRPVRLDLPAGLDFIFDFDNTGSPIFIPLAALGNSSSNFNSGFRRTDAAFDDIDLAEVDGYTTNDTVPIAVGERFYIRSGIPDLTLCLFGLPFYGKLEILEVDPVARTVLFRTLIDANCGYRGLLEGLPTR